MDPTPTSTITGSTDETNGTASSALLKTQKIRGRIQFMALCWFLFLLGWNDGCTGPLLPRIKEVYQVGHRDH